MNIQVVNTKTNNLSNVLRALQQCGYDYQVVDSASQLQSGSIVLLPGVGAFASCMDALNQAEFSYALRQHLQSGGKLLGICVGMQALANYSTEFGQHQGLGLVDAAVCHLTDDFPESLVTPNINWLPLQSQGSRFAQFAGQSVYFVHSYHMCHFAEPAQIAATVDYHGKQITAIVDTGQLIGFQFHPEKSGEVGLRILKTAIELLAA